MRTKTLLIAVAALAAGLVSSQAQTVYSANVVGYINQTIPANSYQIIGSQLVNGSDVGATNGDINTTLITGLVSSPIDPPSSSSNSVLLYWAGSGFATYYYFNAADATAWEGFTSPAGWYDLLGNQASVNLKDGKAAFIYNHSSSPLTVTTVGTVKQGTNYATINAGYNLISLQVPISTNPVVSGYGLPGNLTSSSQDPPSISRNDVLLYWAGSGFATYYFFNAADATAWEGFSSPAGFYDQLGNAMPVTPQVNQGFFLYHSGSSITWTNAFTVQ